MLVLTDRDFRRGNVSVIRRPYLPSARFSAFGGKSKSRGRNAEVKTF